MASHVDAPVHHGRNTAIDLCMLWLQRSWRATQEARLVRAMAMMTDDQLARIGIARSGIPARAASIMNAGA